MFLLIISVSLTAHADPPSCMFKVAGLDSCDIFSRCRYGWVCITYSVYQKPGSFALQIGRVVNLSSFATEAWEMLREAPETLQAVSKRPLNFSIPLLGGVVICYRKTWHVFIRVGEIAWAADDVQNSFSLILAYLVKKGYLSFHPIPSSINHDHNFAHNYERRKRNVCETFGKQPVWK